MKNLERYVQESKQVISLSCPTILSQVTRLLSNVIATAMIASLGTQALAASALALTYYITLFLFSMGMLFAVSISVGNYFGAKDHQNIEKSAACGIALAIMLSVPMIALLHMGSYIFLWCGQKPAIVKLAQSYLNGLSVGIVPALVITALQQFLLGISRPKILNVFALVGLVVNIILFYLLIFGKYGFPALGIAGAGYGGSLSMWLVLIVVVSYIIYNPFVKRFSVFSQLFKPQWQSIKRLIAIGWPISISMTLEMLAFLVLVFFIGIINTSALAAFQIVYQISLIPIMIPVAVSQAIAVIISQHLGQGQSDRIAQSAVIAVIISLSLIGIFSLVFWMIPATITGWFLHREPNVSVATTHFAIIMLAITGFIQLGDALRLTITGALRGMEDVRMPLWISIFCFLIIGIPLAAFVGFILKLGAIAVLSSDAVGVLLSAILLTKRLTKNIYYRYHC